MKIAVISDIHSNYDALERIVKKIDQYNCMYKICLGDMIGYYDKPNEVINTLRQSNFICVKGNHDKYILGELAFKSEFEEIYGIKRHRDVLSKDNYLYLERCLDFFEIRYKDKYIMFCHALKTDSTVYLNDQSEYAKIRNEFEAYDMYFHGHTHKPTINVLNRTVIINPGSVGQPRGDYWKPSFCILDLRKNEYEIVHVEYDIKSYVERLKQQKYDKRLTDILVRNFYK
jgi:putative phosphoesterase